MIDMRMDDKSVWTLNAHYEGINGLSLSSQCPDCLITGSSDKTVKIWDISNNQPTCVQVRTPLVLFLDFWWGLKFALLKINCDGILTDFDKLLIVSLKSLHLSSNTPNE